MLLGLQDEKKSRLFRSSVSGSGISGGGKKKQQQSLTISTEQQLRPTSAEHTAQSPTNVEVITHCRAYYNTIYSRLTLSAAETESPGTDQ